MHVLVLTTSYGTRDRGRRAFDLGRALVRAGHDVTVLTHGESGPGELERGRARIVWVGDHPPMIPSWDVLPWTLQVNSVLMAALTTIEPAPDVVHAVGWDVAWAAMSAPALLDVPVIATAEIPSVHPEAPSTHKVAIHRAHAWMTAQADAELPVPARWWGRRRYVRRTLAAYEDAVAVARARRAREHHPVRGDAAAELA